MRVRAGLAFSSAAYDDAVGLSGHTQVLKVAEAEKLEQQIVCDLDALEADGSLRKFQDFLAADVQS